MTCSWTHVGRAALLSLLCTLVPSVNSQTEEQNSRPIVVSAHMHNGVLVYEVDGKKVEDSSTNSLITNLGRIAKVRGTESPVFIIVDVRARLAEFGKLETALDKVDFTHNRSLFVTNFRDGTMNEIHWDKTSIPIPRR
jgi:hypothetical protein